MSGTRNTVSNLVEFVENIKLKEKINKYNMRIIKIIIFNKINFDK